MTSACGNNHAEICDALERTGEKDILTGCIIGRTIQEMRRNERTGNSISVMIKTREMRSSAEYTRLLARIMIAATIRSKSIKVGVTGCCKHALMESWKRVRSAVMERDMELKETPDIVNDYDDYAQRLSYGDFVVLQNNKISAREYSISFMREFDVLFVVHPKGSCVHCMTVSYLVEVANPKCVIVYLDAKCPATQISMDFDD